MSEKDSNEEMNDVNEPSDDLNEEEGGLAGRDALLKELNASQAQVAEQMETVLRAKAEIENIRRRSAEDVQKAHKYGNERFLKELLPVIDSLERCLETKLEEDNATLKTIHEGVELTYQMFLQSLDKVGAEQINPLHEDFNPELHEAMAREAAGEGVKSGSILKVFQRGYVLSGRLIRPALVVVAQ